jgi:Uncharacterised protein family (UPF0158)
MKRLPVDVAALQTALEDYDGGLGLHTYWFDTQTGEVIFLTEDLEEQDELRQQIEEDATNRFAMIEPISSHDGFRIMEDFVESLPHTRLREKLEWCLGGPKPFRRFKDALHENKAVQEKWYEFHDKALERYGIEWLAELDIEPLSRTSTGRDIGNETIGEASAINVELEQTCTAESTSKSPPSVPSPKKTVRKTGAKSTKAQHQASEAGREFVCRELRLHHPDGTFDDGGRFYPSEKEVRDCCANIRAPSRAFPFSLMTHCRTVKHVAKLYDVSQKELKAGAEKVKEQLWYLCHIRDFDRIRNIIESPVLTVDPFLAPPGVQPPRAILEETRTHGILKRQVWDSLFAAFADYEERWQRRGQAD